MKRRDIEAEAKTDYSDFRALLDNEATRLDGEFITEETQAPPGFVPTPAPSGLMRAPRPGEVLAGRYRVVEELGAGAMGAVYLAEHVVIGCRVAVKLILPELLADASSKKRFLQEAHACAAIKHPNVARFLDLVVGDPSLLVLEHVSGPTLQAVLKQGRLPVPRAIAIAVRLCWGLEAAHAAGLVHRDLKPANIILTQDLERGEQPVLVDFGLAKQVGPIDAHAKTLGTQVTQIGQIVGTPQYMSPEQISGHPVDRRSDVYGLACLLYELIAGRPPFMVGAGGARVLFEQLEQTPDPLSKHAKGISPQLDAVMARALAKRPDKRFTTTVELAKALERTQAPEAPAAPVAGSRLPALIAAGVTVGLGIGLLLGYLRFGR